MKIINRDLMVNEDDLIKFVEKYYLNKDIMHDMSHIKRVKYSLNNLLSTFDGYYNEEILNIALHFHGFVYTYENVIRDWLIEKGISDKTAAQIILVAWESQKDKEAKTIEGKLLHDAHMIEGGQTFLVIKSLITGSVRGQNLDATIMYIENNILDKGVCYLPQAQAIYESQQRFAKETIQNLKSGIGL